MSVVSDPEALRQLEEIGARPRVTNVERNMVEYNNLWYVEGEPGKCWVAENHTTITDPTVIAMFEAALGGVIVTFNTPNGRREIGVVDDVGPTGLLIYDLAITYYVSLPLRQRGINIYSPSDISVSRPRT